MDHTLSVVPHRPYWAIADELFQDWLGLTRSEAVVAFDDSLLLNLLLGDGLVIADGPFFSSPLIRDHILTGISKSNVPLLVRAIQRELVIPAFRGPGNENFSDVLSSLRKGGTVGLLSESNEIARYIDKTAKVGDKVAPMHWPNVDTGESLGDLMVILEADDPPPIATQLQQKYQDEIEDVWKRTRLWRKTAIPIARKRTEEGGWKGIRKGEVYKAVAEVEQWEDVSTPASLIASAQGDKRELLIFTRWVADLHRINLTAKLSTVLPVMHNAVDIHPVHSLMYLQRAAGQVQPIDAGTERFFEMDVRLPPLRALRSLDTGRLLDIREEEGAAYRFALESWQLDPSRSNEVKLEASLKEYSGLLCKRVADLARATDPIEVVMRARTSAAQKAVASALSTFLWAAGTFTHEPRLAASGPLLAGTYVAYYLASSVRNRPRRRRLRLETVLPSSEIVLP